MAYSVLQRCFLCGRGKHPVVSGTLLRDLRTCDIGLVAGCLIHFLSPKAQGFGLPEVIEAIAFNKGRISPLYSFVKVTTASICIGTGGSVGIVGPIMQLGAGLGSYLGQLLRLSDEKVRVLVACGAAGGVATTFNAPIAGVFFAMEAILREFSSRSFAMVVIASVVASEIGRLYFGNFPAFEVLPHALGSSWELLLYGILGVVAPDPTGPAPIQQPATPYQGNHKGCPYPESVRCHSVTIVHVGQQWC